MSIQLTEEQFRTWVDMLEGLAGWQSEQGRLDLMNEVFAASPRKRDVLRVRLDGDAHGTAVRVVQHLAQFGQHAPGQESLVALAGRLLRSFGTGSREEAFLQGFIANLPMTTLDDDRAKALPPPTPRAVRDVLAQHFTIKELQDMWFDLDENYQNVQHDTLQTFARETVSYFERRGRLADLVSAIRRARTNVF